MNRKFSSIRRTGDFPARMFSFNRLYGTVPEQGSHNFDQGSDEAPHELEQPYLANYDRLTGLPNRKLFMDHLHQALLHAAREQKQLALLYLDIDRFWQVNELHGRTTGDELLQSVALRLKHCISGGDALARLSGDEFAMVLRNVDGLDGVMKALDKIVTSFRRHFQLGEQTLTASASIGVSIYPRDGGEARNLLRCADVALYRSKTAGGNGYCFFQTGIGGLEDAGTKLEKL